MDPQEQFCHNPDSPVRGRTGLGNIRRHGRKLLRFRCTVCEKTFVPTKGTPLYRCRKDEDVITLVLKLCAHGCPIQAVVAAFELDERTVTQWLLRAGQHCERVHEHLVLQGKVDLQAVQADELKVNVVRPGRSSVQGSATPTATTIKEEGSAVAEPVIAEPVVAEPVTEDEQETSGPRVRAALWMAMAIAVPSRLWLGGQLSPHRDSTLIEALVHMVRASAAFPAILVCVDGLKAYVGAFQSIFRLPVREGRTGRPRLVLPQGFLMAQVIKRYAKKRVEEVTRRVVCGTEEEVQDAIRRSGAGKEINTSYIERFNATMRSLLAPLTRRGRALVHKTEMLQAGMYLAGCAYNFCWHHDSLRVEVGGNSGKRWEQRTPAMAAALTDHKWSMHELLTYQVPPPPWEPPRRRGRKPSLQTVISRWKRDHS